MHLWKHTKSGTWYVKRPDGTRSSLKTKDKNLALSRLEDMRRAPKGALLHSDVEHYLAEKTSKRSHTQMKIAWMHLKPFFGHLRHDQVTRQLCRDYVTSRIKSGARTATVAREIGVLKAAVRYSHPISPAQWDVPASSPPRERRLTRDEYLALLDACDVLHVRLFVVLALATGARKEALLELTWDRVDFDRRLINLRRDGLQGKGRAIVPMTPMALDALRQAQELAQTPNVIEYAGEPIKAVKRGFARACKRAGLVGVTPHVLRHTAATWMAEAGVPMSEIAQFLGHKDSRITERVYAKFSPSYLSRAASALQVMAPGQIEPVRPVRNVIRGNFAKTA